MHVLVYVYAMCGVVAALVSLIRFDNIANLLPEIPVALCMFMLTCSPTTYAGISCTDEWKMHDGCRRTQMHAYWCIEYIGQNVYSVIAFRSHHIDHYSVYHLHVHNSQCTHCSFEHIVHDGTNVHLNNVHIVGRVFLVFESAHSPRQ